jgi:peptide chain release factor subunit 1
VSVYVDLDPSEFGTPRARRAQIESLVAEARQRWTGADQNRGFAHEDVLTRDVERVRRYLEAYRPEGARAVAVFCSSGDGLFEVVRLDRTVRPAMRIGPRPWLKPLLAARPETLDCTVLAVSKQEARLFEAAGGGLTEVRDFAGRSRLAGHGHADMPHQRHVEEQVRRHVDEACRALATRAGRKPVRSLVLASPTELRDTVVPRLRSSERDRMIGHIPIDDVEEVTAAQLAPEARRLVDETRARDDERAMSRLRDALGRGEGAAAGIKPVLGILNDRRAGEVVMADAFEAAGSRCPSCGRLYATGTRCPFDDSALRRVDDLAEAVVESAIAQSAPVHVVGGDPPFELGVAAIARYERDS